MSSWRKAEVGKILVGALVWLVAMPCLRAQREAPALAVAFGTGNYLGDIGGTDEDSRGFLFDLHPQATRTSLSVTYAHPLGRQLWIEGQGSWVNLYDDDAFTASGPRRARNLHFRNSLYELTLRARWVVWSGPNFQTAGERYPSMFVFAGAGGFHHNPQTRLRNAADNGNVWYDLRELKTEGQASPYSRFAMSFPVGMGMEWTVAAGWKLGWEASWRWTTTDYLDDVSGQYGPSAEMTPLAEALSSQTDLYALQQADASWTDAQLVHFQEGAPRGNPESADGFGTLQVRLSKSLEGRQRSMRARSGKRKVKKARNKRPNKPRKRTRFKTWWRGLWRR